MEKGNNGMEEMEQEIKRIIADNKRFLEKMMDDAFEPDEPDSEEFEEL